MPIIQTNGGELYYEIHGTGQPLVLIAGYGCDHTFWLPVLEDLSNHFKVITFDNRAVGQTKDQGEPLSVELMAQDVVTLLNKLNIEKAHVAGQSMGGMIAREIALSYPDKIEKLAIITSSIRCREPALFAFKTMLQMRKENIDFDLIFKTMLPWIFGEKFLQNTHQVEQLKNDYLANPYPQSIDNQERQIKLLEKFNDYNQLPSIKKPTMILTGSQDMICLPQEAHIMRKQISNSQFREFDCAHGIVAEIPQLLSQALLAFLQNAT